MENQSQVEMTPMEMETETRSLLNNIHVQYHEIVNEITVLSRRMRNTSDINVRRRFCERLIALNRRLTEILIAQGNTENVLHSNFMPQPIVARQRRNTKPVLTCKRMTKKTALETTDTDCPVCYESCEATNLVTLGCGHKFCVSCVSGHFKVTTDNARQFKCPMCRQEVKKMELNYTAEQGKKSEVLNGSLVAQLKNYCCVK